MSNLGEAAARLIEGLNAGRDPAEAYATVLAWWDGTPAAEATLDQVMAGRLAVGEGIGDASPATCRAVWACAKAITGGKVTNQTITVYANIAKVIRITVDEVRREAI